jgi:hypothetical protein
MKRFLVLFMMVAFVTLIAAPIFADGQQEPSSMDKGQTAKETQLQKLIKKVPVPDLTAAQEREMIARRALLFNTDHKIGYVYVFIAGSSTPLGYYVTNGKVASLNSFLVPQQTVANYGEHGGAVVLEDADIDGTYGNNIEGVFFFTDNNIYVEIPTNGCMGYLYADQPLPIRVPKLNIQITQ